ncbi:FAD-binding monooxygenase [Pigmentiphaga sp. NML080357]|uniref:FAD-dependent oxidoreductase n=1 Tax=Pigmentiphaga sp. NML080357 TaxID=2008675 RepID=UPI000B41845D|nr:NAD(P)/FAD-dependent oxidoreductase [Pigmentiphaga sp. NML080357]OVZ56591.1 FAD-binding monooxygenase [Pigmentiphaga sp. NML080357]
MTQKDKQRVLIVGAGPVGMVCALALNRQGIPVTVFEQEPGPVKDQRAASIHPTTLAMLDELDVTRAIVPRGLVSETYQYRDRVSGKLIAEFDLRRLADVFKFPFVLQYEQYKLTHDIAEQYANESDFDVRYGHAVTHIEQHADYVEIAASGPDGIRRYRGAYLIGADGGRSTVRKAADIAFEGFTYQERFIKIATTFDFQRAHPDYAYRNYFSDPDEWCNLFKVRGEDGEGLWRAIFPTRVDETEEEALSEAGVEARLQKFFPKAGRYEVAYCNVYGVNQRVAQTFRRGRVLLAGDAAHVNNPIGGMGMNGGIHDAVNLAGKLGAVLTRGADDALLDLYSRQRRHAAVAFVQAQTIANKKMLEEKDERSRQEKFEELARTADDPAGARQYMRRASLLESLETANAIT